MKKSAAGRRVCKAVGFLLVIVLVVTNCNWTAGGSAQAAETEEIELVCREESSDGNKGSSGSDVVPDGKGKIDIHYEVPAGYSSLNALLDDGYGKMAVDIAVSDFSIMDGENAGIMPYFLYGDYEFCRIDWYNLTVPVTRTLTFDLSSLGNSDTLQRFGIQIANVSGSVSYEISSVKLVKTGAGGSGGSDGPGGEIGAIDTSTDYNFAKLLQLSLYFYDANMCGNGVDEHSLYSKSKYGGWRSNCHTTDHFNYGGKDYYPDGGYHDAGDHVKFGVPMSETFIMLGAGYDNFKDAYSKTGQTGHFQTITDYYCEYIRNCMVLDENGDLEAFCYQVGNGNSDHDSWTPPEDEDVNATNRKDTLIATGSKPGTDVVAGSAAAVAFNYLNFHKAEDLETAKTLFAFAKAHEKQVAEQVGGFYVSSRWVDKYCLAAALLYQATGNAEYKTEYNAYSSSLSKDITQVASWDNVAQLAVFYAPEKNTAQVNQIGNFFDEIKNSNASKYYFQDKWGSARYNCNMQLMMQIYDKRYHAATPRYQDWCRYQMTILLGNNEIQKNLVCGYNNASPKEPHHRAASGSNHERKYTLYGALVGGPDTPLFSSYVDDVGNYVTNEVACDYNACLVGAAAALYLQNKDSDEDGFKVQTLLDDFYGGKNFSGTTNPGGDNPGGDNPGNDNPGGDNPGGDNPGNDNPGGDNPGGDNPGNDNPGGDNPGGDNPGGDNPGNDNPGGDNPGGDNPGNDNPGGDNPGGDNPGNDNPGGDNPGGDNPGNDNPGGDNPGGNDPGTVESPSPDPSVEPSAAATPSASPSAVPSEVPGEEPGIAPTPGVNPGDAVYDVFWGEILPQDRPATGGYPEGLWMAPLPAGIPYTGKAVTLDLHIYCGNTRLLEGVDYTAAYKNNKKVYDGPLNAPKAPSVTVKGKGNYAGQFTKKFCIYAATAPAVNGKVKLTEAACQIYLPDKGEYDYVKGGVKPVVKVYLEGKLLRYGKDYTVKYENAANAGSAVAVIKGKGSYSGEIKQNYRIRPAKLSDLTVAAKDKARKNTADCKTSFVIYDRNGKKLSAGKDYDKTNIRYYYLQDTTLEDGRTVGKDTQAQAADKIASDSAVKMVVSAAGGNYTGEIACGYMVKTGDFAKVKIKIASKGYTGEPVTLQPSDIHVTLKGVELRYGTDFVVDEGSYTNNILKGTARVTIRGIGSYEGFTKQGTFKIERKSLNHL